MRFDLKVTISEETPELAAEDVGLFKALVMSMIKDRTDKDLDFYQVMLRWPEPGEIEYTPVKQILERLEKG